MPRRLLFTALTCVACGVAPGPVAGGANRLQLGVPDDVTLDDGQQTVIIFTSVNAQAAPTYTTGPLPDFATFSVDTLTIKPRHLIDAGSYSVEVEVTDGIDHASRTLTIHVMRSFTPPYLGGLYFMTGCPGWSRIGAPPDPGTWVENYTKDEEREATRLEFEVVPSGGMLTGAVTQATPMVETGAGLGTTTTYPDLANFHVVLSGLTIGSKYRGQFRAVDASGQKSDWLTLCEGRDFDALP